MQNTQVKDIMKSRPDFVTPGDTLKKAAEKMKNIDCGVLPVGSESKVEGIITDRDIVIRAVSEGRDPAEEKVNNYMTKKIYFCKETDTVQDAADMMREHDVNRLVVKNDGGKVSGIISFGCMLRKNENADEVAEVVERATGRANASDSTTYAS
jgi:CBS domain-containing protein